MKIRPKLEKVSEEMKAWSTLLGQELEKWPELTSRRMFGMTLFYRGRSVFAALPRTRSFESPDAVAFKLHAMDAKTAGLLRSEPSIALPANRAGGWISFAIRDSRHLSAALAWLLRAYESASKTPRK